MEPRATGDDPIDIAGWLVEADKLTEAGDPAGELIVLEERLARSAVQGADSTLASDRRALLARLATTLKGRAARGVLAVGNTAAPNGVHQRIQAVLLERYSLAHLIVFAQQTGSGDVTIADVAKNLQVELPESFHAFYEWARTLVTRFPGTFDLPLPFEGAYRISSPADILSDTEMWRELQREQPDREWRDGFVHVASWSGAYEMVIDTAGKVSAPAQQLYFWDFKGGEVFWRRHPTFDSYVEAVLALLEQNAYFKVDGNDHWDAWNDLVRDHTAHFPFAY